MRCLEIARDHNFVSSTNVRKSIQSSSLIIFVNNILVIFTTLSPSLPVTKSHILFRAEPVSTVLQTLTFVPYACNKEVMQTVHLATPLFSLSYMSTIPMNPEEIL